MYIQLTLFSGCTFSIMEKPKHERCCEYFLFLRNPTRTIIFLFTTHRSYVTWSDGSGYWTARICEKSSMCGESGRQCRSHGCGEHVNGKRWYDQLWNERERGTCETLFRRSFVVRFFVPYVYIYTNPDLESKSFKSVTGYYFMYTSCMFIHFIWKWEKH